MKTILITVFVGIFSLAAFANSTDNNCKYGTLSITIKNASTHLKDLAGRIAISGDGGYPDQHFSFKHGKQHTYTYNTEADGCWIQDNQEIGTPPEIYEKIFTKKIKKHWFDKKFITYQIPLDLQKRGDSFSIDITAYDYKSKGVCISGATHYPDGHGAGYTTCFDKV